MCYISANKAVEIKFELSGIDGYVFCSDKKLYNAKTSRIIKQTINNRRIGYWIGKRFYSLKQLRPLLIKPNKTNCPF